MAVQLAAQVRAAEAQAAHASAEAERDAAIAQARAEADQRGSAFEADRDQALAPAEMTEQALRLASKMPPVRRQALIPPGPRSAGSAPTHTRCWPTVARRPPATATSCAPTCGQEPIASPTPTAMN